MSKKSFKPVITEKDTRPRAGHTNLSGMGAHQLLDNTKRTRQNALREARNAISGVEVDSGIEPINIWED